MSFELFGYLNSTGIHHKSGCATLFPRNKSAVLGRLPPTCIGPAGIGRCCKVCGGAVMQPAVAGGVSQSVAVSPAAVVSVGGSGSPSAPTTGARGRGYINCISQIHHRSGCRTLYPINPRATLGCLPPGEIEIGRARPCIVCGGAIPAAIECAAVDVCADDREVPAEGTVAPPGMRDHAAANAVVAVLVALLASTLVPKAHASAVNRFGDPVVFAMRPVAWPRCPCPRVDLSGLSENETASGCMLTFERWHVLGKECVVSNCTVRRVVCPQEKVVGGGPHGGPPASTLVRDALEVATRVRSAVYMYAWHFHNVEMARVARELTARTGVALARVLTFLHLSMMAALVVAGCVACVAVYSGFGLSVAVWVCMIVVDVLTIIGTWSGRSLSTFWFFSVFILVTGGYLCEKRGWKVCAFTVAVHLATRLLAPLEMSLLTVCIGGATIWMVGRALLIGLGPLGRVALSYWDITGLTATTALLSKAAGGGVVKFESGLTCKAPVVRVLSDVWVVALKPRFYLSDGKLLPEGVVKKHQELRPLFNLCNANIKAVMMSEAACRNLIMTEREIADTIPTIKYCAMARDFNAHARWMLDAYYATTHQHNMTWKRVSGQLLSANLAVKSSLDCYSRPSICGVLHAESGKVAKKKGGKRAGAWFTQAEYSELLANLARTMSMDEARDKINRIAEEMDAQEHLREEGLDPDDKSSDGRDEKIPDDGYDDYVDEIAENWTDSKREFDLDRMDDEERARFREIDEALTEAQMDFDMAFGKAGEGGERGVDWGGAMERFECAVAKLKTLVPRTRMLVPKPTRLRPESALFPRSERILTGGQRLVKAALLDNGYDISDQDLINRWSRAMPLPRALWSKCLHIPGPYNVGSYLAMVKAEADQVIEHGALCIDSSTQVETEALSQPEDAGTRVVAEGVVYTVNAEGMHEGEVVTVTSPPPVVEARKKRVRKVKVAEAGGYECESSIACRRSLRDCGVAALEVDAGSGLYEHTVIAPFSYTARSGQLCVQYRSCYHGQASRVEIKPDTVVKVHHVGAIASLLSGAEVTFCCREQCVVGGKPVLENSTVTVMYRIPAAAGPLDSLVTKLNSVEMGRMPTKTVEPKIGTSVLVLHCTLNNDGVPVFGYSDGAVVALAQGGFVIDAPVTCARTGLPPDRDGEGTSGALVLEKRTLSSVGVHVGHVDHDGVKKNLFYPITTTSGKAPVALKEHLRATEATYTPCSLQCKGLPLATPGAKWDHVVVSQDNGVTVGRTLDLAVAHWSERTCVRADAESVEREVLTSRVGLAPVDHQLFRSCVRQALFNAKCMRRWKPLSYFEATFTKSLGKTIGFPGEAASLATYADLLTALALEWNPALVGDEAIYAGRVILAEYLEKIEAYIDAGGCITSYYSAKPKKDMYTASKVAAGRFRSLCVPYVVEHCLVSRWFCCVEAAFKINAMESFANTSFATYEKKVSRHRSKYSFGVDLSACDKTIPGNLANIAVDEMAAAAGCRGNLRSWLVNSVCCPQVLCPTGSLVVMSDTNPSGNRLTTALNTLVYTAAFEQCRRIVGLPTAIVLACGDDSLASADTPEELALVRSRIYTMLEEEFGFKPKFDYLIGTSGELKCFPPGLTPPFLGMVEHYPFDDSKIYVLVPSDLARRVSRVPTVTDPEDAAPEAIAERLEGVLMSCSGWLYLHQRGVHTPAVFRSLMDDCRAYGVDIDDVARRVGCVFIGRQC